MTAITENKIPVSFTPNALAELKNLFAKGNYGPDYGLRVGMKGGGCAGFSYILDFDTAKENDNIFEIVHKQITDYLSVRLYHRFQKRTG